MCLQHQKSPCRLVVKSSRCGVLMVDIILSLREAGSSNPPWDIEFYSIDKCLCNKAYVFGVFLRSIQASVSLNSYFVLLLRMYSTYFRIRINKCRRRRMNDPKFVVSHNDVHPQLQLKSPERRMERRLGCAIYTNGMDVFLGFLNPLGVSRSQVRGR